MSWFGSEPHADELAEPWPGDDDYRPLNPDRVYWTALREDDQ